MTALEIEKELIERGLIMHVGGGELKDVLAQPRRVYLGVDPTADSLHVGNMIPVILMKHLSQAGHTPYFLVGGGTGVIGDPRESGERPMIDLRAVEENAEAIRQQMSSLLQLDAEVEIFNNHDWLIKLGMLEFLRDVGKHFTVNQLVKRDIIKRRLETEEDSISYTEFSYSLLQAYDYWHLYHTKQIDLQVGGSDQWANIISGVDLIRRKEQASAYALTTPMVIDKTTGKKFGKSEGNAVWLNPDKTSPYTFYQFWLNVSDENVEDYLKIFSFIPLSDIAELIAAHTKEPHLRKAQRELARAVTELVHGDSVTQTVERVTNILFSGTIPAELTSEDKKILLAEAPSAILSGADLESGYAVTDALIATELVPSKNEARRLLASNSVSVNGELVSDTTILTTAHLQSGVIYLKKGKSVALLVVQDS